MQVIYPLSGHHILPLEAQPITWYFCWDEDTTGMVLQMNADTTSHLLLYRSTRTRRIEKLCMDLTNLALVLM